MTELMEGIHDPWSRSQVKHRVALQRACTSAPEAEALFDEALDDARRVESSSSRSMVIRDVTASMVQAGLYEKAAAAIREIDETSNREEALGQLAEALAKIGQDEEAAALTAEISNELWRSNSYRRLSDALIERGKFRQAVEVIGKLPSPASRASALLPLAESVGRKRPAGLDDPFGLAIKAARSVEGPRTRVLGQDRAALLTWVATALARFGDARAEEIFREAAESALQNPDEEIGAGSIRDLGMELCRIGQHVWAMNLANQVRRPEFQSIVLFDLAAALTETGRYEPAAEAARAIPDDHFRAEALSNLALASAKEGYNGAASLLEEAIGSASSMRDAESWANTLLHLAWALRQTGRDLTQALFDEALDACENIPDPRSRANALHSLAVDLARAERDKQAVAVARLVPDEWMRPRVMRDVIIALARGGQVERAIELSPELEDDFDGKLQRELASIMIEKGDLAKAGHSQRLGLRTRLRPWESVHWSRCVLPRIACYRQAHTRMLRRAVNQRFVGAFWTRDCMSGLARLQSIHGGVLRYRRTRFV